MACQRCREVPGSHSVTLVGDHHLFMAPARAKESIDTEEEFRVFSEHLAPFKTKPWTWIFDCRDMTFSHYTNTLFIRCMTHLLSTEHDQRLQEIWVLNPGYLVGGVLAIVQALSADRLVQKVKLCKTDRLELLNQLKGPRAVVDWVIRVSSLPTSEPLTS